MAYKLAFGDYLFPGTIVPESEPGQQELSMVPRPRATGSRRGSSTPRRTGQTLAARGEVTADSADVLETILSGMRKALYEKIDDLYFGRDDRYYKNAVCRQFGISYAEDGILYGVVVAVSLVFDVSEFPNPVLVDGTVTDSLNPAGETYTIDSEARVLPVWEITIGSAGTGTLTLANTTTRETATLIPPYGSSSWTSGAVIKLDRVNYRVYYPDGVTEDFGMLSGRIPTLDPTINGGDNVLTLTSSGTATISALSVSYESLFS